MSKIPIAENNGINAAVEENTAKMSELIDVLRELQKREDERQVKSEPGVDWRRIRTGFLVTLLIAVGGLAFNTFLLARDTAKDVQVIMQRLDALPSPDVLRRLNALEAWRDRHQENGK